MNVLIVWWIVIGCYNEKKWVKRLKKKIVVENEEVDLVFWDIDREVKNCIVNCVKKL